MNMSFLMAGTVSTNPVLFFAGILLILAWKNAGYLGIDRYLLPMLGTPWKQPSSKRRHLETPVPTPPDPLTPAGSANAEPASSCPDRRVRAPAPALDGCCQRTASEAQGCGHHVEDHPPPTRRIPAGGASTRPTPPRSLDDPGPASSWSRPFRPTRFRAWIQSDAQIADHRSRRSVSVEAWPTRLTRRRDRRRVARLLRRSRQRHPGRGRTSPGRPDRHVDARSSAAWAACCTAASPTRCSAMPRRRCCWCRRSSSTPGRRIGRCRCWFRWTVRRSAETALAGRRALRRSVRVAADAAIRRRAAGLPAVRRWLRLCPVRRGRRAGERDISISSERVTELRDAGRDHTPALPSAIRPR